ncbi:hypothetical protein Bhyg_09454 [Pseudolycoriella hygida]|uniref:VWFC domain-containing protein n=1 Tax=Pseudolycoriella hygida TaxID=35572 RepID=A0A9Q0S5T1_9DIPT|nr:hypothetical protein Bhyg_09454 [Pseudolycoriella hygida]
MLLNVLLLLSVACVSVHCNCGPCGPMPKHYEELRCVGQYIDGPCCHERYECPDLASFDTKFCHLNGKTYGKGEIASKEDSPPCSQNCICAEGGNGDLKFVCPIVECPEMFHDPEANCIHKYSLDQCCSVEKTCGAESQNLPQCYFRGEKYNYGEKFVPQSYYSACHHCVCDEHFDNSTNIEENKNCKKTDCGLQLRYLDKFKSGCVPIYFRDTKCCPVGFRCPSDKDQIIPVEGQPDISLAKPHSLCKFGSLTLQRGQRIATDEKCLQCSCRHPPMIECVRVEQCE